MTELTKLVETAVVTVASVHDIQTVLGLVEAGIGVVYGNSAYGAAWVTEQLNDTEKEENQEISRTRRGWSTPLR